MDWGEFGKKIIGKKMIVLLLVTGAVYFFLQYLTPLSAPVLLAMLFVTIFGPMMKRMNQRLHFPRPLSAIVLLIVATVLLVGLLWILVSWMLGSLPVWIGNLELREQEWLEAVRGLCRNGAGIRGGRDYMLDSRRIFSSVNPSLSVVCHCRIFQIRSLHTNNLSHAATQPPDGFQPLLLPQFQIADPYRQAA